MSDRYGQIEIIGRDDWRGWLDANHDREPGVWLVTFKQPDERHVPDDAIVEEALCFGWIDSLPRRLDERRSKLLVTRRKPGSGWSRVNKERVARLEAAGLIAPAGRDVIDAARQDGSWSKLDDVENLIEPDDLRAALDARPEARRHWDAFPRSAKRGILEWIGNAKRAETRQKRLEETAEKAARNVRANQWRQPER